ncbi:hypothetical protein M3J09_002682 [Ascochyta lentis]
MYTPIDPQYASSAPKSCDTQNRSLSKTLKEYTLRSRKIQVAQKIHLDDYTHGHGHTRRKDER